MPEHSCKKCGEKEWIKNGTSWRCHPCKLADAKRYYLENRAERMAKRNAYIAANREEIYRRNTEWRNANKAQENARLRKHYEENKTYYNAKSAAYRAKQREAIPSWFDKEEVTYIYSLAKERNLEVDHIVPITHELVCGLHVQDNLRCIPATLNKFKSNRYWANMPRGE